MSLYLKTLLQLFIRWIGEGAAFLERRFVFGFVKWWLQLRYRGTTVPVSKLIFFRSLARSKNVFTLEHRTFRTYGKNLRNPFLASRLTKVELGTMRLTVPVLDFLEQRIQILKPKVVLEFGSGISTGCFAQYMRELHGDSNRVYVFSIEQELKYALETTELLKTLQLAKYAKVVHSPLREQVIEGFRTACYDLSGDFLVSFLEGYRPDFVLIDGPGSEPITRFGTLPLVRPFLKSGAWFFLDDALRDGELEVAQLWSQLPYVQVSGIYLLGKWLLVGQVGKVFDDATEQMR